MKEKQKKRKKRRAEQRDVVNVFTNRTRGERAELLDTLTGQHCNTTTTIIYDFKNMWIIILESLLDS